MKKQLYYLICGCFAILSLLLIFIPSHTFAQTPALEINLITGNEAGEYYSVGKDIEKLAKTQNIDIDIIPSRGALQNIDSVFYHQSIPLGITQSDILAFLNIFANNDPEIRTQAESLQAVIPLYREDVYLITRKDIKSIEDLTGKRVSLGEAGSGTSTTASTLLYQLKVNSSELVNFDTKRSIDALREKEVDGFFYVVGTPAKVLQEQIFEDDNFQILPLALPAAPNDEFLAKLYNQNVIPAKTYSWQKDPVNTLSVQSFLFTVVDADCQKVNSVAKLISNNLAWLQKNGDPIWKKVNLKDLSQLNPKRVSSCVAKF